MYFQKNSISVGLVSGTNDNMIKVNNNEKFWKAI